MLLLSAVVAGLLLPGSHLVLGWSVLLELDKVLPLAEVRLWVPLSVFPGLISAHLFVATCLGHRW